MRSTGLATRKGVAYFEFDFAKHGGAIAAITVEGDEIPKGAIITSGIHHITAAVTSDGNATVAVMALGAGDLLTATAKSSLTLNALIDTVPDGAATNMIRVTSNITSLTYTVAVAALTAGKIVTAVEYVVTA